MLDMGLTYETIAESLSVGKAKVTEWLSRTVKEKKERRDKKIFDLWMACHTQEEIAEACGCGQKTVDDVLEVFSGSVLENQSAKAIASHAVDFDPPISNIWKQQTKSEGSSHFGNSEVAEAARADLSQRKPLPHASREPGLQAFDEVGPQPSQILRGSEPEIGMRDQPRAQYDRRLFQKLVRAETIKLRWNPGAMGEDRRDAAITPFQATPDAAADR